MKRFIAPLAAALAIAPVLVAFSTPPTMGSTSAVPALMKDAAPVSNVESVLRLPIVVPFNTIEQLVNEKAPKVVRGVKHDPTNALYDDTLRYTIERGHITVANGGDCISVSVPVSGSATAHGRLGARGWLGRRIASTSLSETANFKGTVRGCVSFNIAPDWTLRPNVKLDLDLDRAEVRLIRNWIPVSFRGIATEEFNKQKDAIVRDVSAAVISGLNVQQQVSAAWAAAHAVYPVSANPPVYARLQPKRVIFQPLDFRSPEAVTVGVGLVADIQTYVGVKPTAPVPGPLPAIETAGELAGLTELRVPVVVSLDAVNAQLAQKLASGPLVVDSGRKLAITEAQVQNHGSRAVLKLRYTVKRAWYMPNLSGELHIAAQPVYDAKTQTLAFKRLDYSLETRSALANGAAWLLKPVVLHAIEQRAKVELAPHLAELRKAANAQAALIGERVGMAQALNVEGLRVESIALGGNTLIAIVGSEVKTRIDLTGVSLAALQ